ncbi:hypothetical protein [Deinococcus aquiradiocola]|uniref:Uncharacterized protein n=1 Tax=Deinococcus aquiradiocola TaxID=393059 RepID=A0A917UL22_9DEIO|nr:hypothetical protein [Deinococcus aquiradiocola]GGJ65251.1 hypothetical protein GCM10008939_06440 [Deinococcus aquiradiocola]
MTQHPDYPAEPRTYLEAVKTYVLAALPEVPQGTWEVYSDINTETITFRFADRSSAPFKGVDVWMDIADIATKSLQLVGQLAGEVFIELFKQPLPTKAPGAAYETYFA